MVQVQLEVPLVPLLIWEATLGSVGSSWDLRLPSTSGRNLRALSCSLAEVEMCTIPSCLAGDDWQTCQSWWEWWEWLMLCYLNVKTSVNYANPVVVDVFYGSMMGWVSMTRLGRELIIQEFSGFVGIEDMPWRSCQPCWYRHTFPKLSDWGWILASNQSRIHCPSLEVSAKCLAPQAVHKNCRIHMGKEWKTEKIIKTLVFTCELCVSCLHSLARSRRGSRCHSEKTWRHRRC